MADVAKNVERASAVYNTAGDHALIPAPGAGYSLSIISLYAVANGTEVATITQGGVGSGVLYMVNGVPHVLPDVGVGWTAKADNGALVVSLANGGIDVSLVVVYRAVPTHQEY